MLGGGTDEIFTGRGGTFCSIRLTPLTDVGATSCDHATLFARPLTM
jgi:hypothetical protein